VEMTPRFGKEISVTPEDFLLKTDKDGERTTPFAPSQIAGRGALVVHQTGGGGGATPIHDKTGPIIGGGPGSTGPPTRIGGNTSGDPGTPEGSEAKTRSGASRKEDPILAVLKQKELPQTKTDKPVSGLLYFPMEKQKVKDLELRYDVNGDKIVLRFRPEK